MTFVGLLLLLLFVVIVFCFFIWLIFGNIFILFVDIVDKWDESSGFNCLVDIAVSLSFEVLEQIESQSSFFEFNIICCKVLSDFILSSISISFKKILFNGIIFFILITYIILIKVFFQKIKLKKNFFYLKI